ncbi:response regulator [Bradyrhizobium sp. McL0616]|uniref:response regulator n=1 Tax=Bradyrhizobium sp. McL0616 TaxID=3415674 RepID=UPI003CFB5457
MASVLIVEDEALVRMMVADMLAELGHTVAEAGDLRAGMALAQASDFDAAILDLNLGSVSSEPIAEALQGRGIPFAFATGYGADGLPNGFTERPPLGKPFQIEELDRCLSSLLASGSPTALNRCQ